MNELAVLDRLNPRQRESVDQIYGALMNLAGPGTGKTQVLSSRIANMLVSDAEITPNMILALTFTEAGVIAMRKRLLEIIGTDSYKVAIHTFHSFCNEIIQGNPDYFGLRNHEPVSDLERIEIVHEIIDEMKDDNPLKRFRGDSYYEIRRLNNFFTMFKEESWTIESVESACKAYIESLPDDENYIYKRAIKAKGIVKGDVKADAIAKEAEKMKKLVAASYLVSQYEKKLNDRERYDFSDMIHFVLKAFRTDDFFKLNYQERYQFVLLDEVQDTNKSQMELVSLLIDYWDDPNIFVVGDDDQCVYEFAGARMKNLIDFQERYNAKVIVLDTNYRSIQPILDRASDVIGNNVERLASQGINKDLTAHIPENSDTAPPVVYSFPTKHSEVAWVVSELEKHIGNGVNLSDIGIIYRKHKQADELIQQLQIKKINYNIHRSINVLETVVVKQLLSMLDYVVSLAELGMENKDMRLFEILHFKFFANDISKVHDYYIKKADRNQKERRTKDMVKTERILDDIITDYHNEPLVIILHKLINSTGLLEWVLRQPGSIQLLQYINTFFGWVKTEAFRDTSLKGKKLMEMIVKMKSNGLFLSAIDLHSYSEGVNLLTGHGAKGLEFHHVYMIGCNRNEWEASRAGAMSYSLPPTLTHSGEENKLESNRRLFFVAMTRAMKTLHISYADQTDAGKGLERSQFIDESNIEVSEGPKVDLDLYLQNAITTPVLNFDLNKEAIKIRLKDFRLSVSALNKYLRCQVAFYYENVLRVPFVAQPALIFGNGIHLALKRLYDSAKHNKTLSLVQFKTVFYEYMEKQKSQLTQAEYNRRLVFGYKTLIMFYDKYFPSSNKNTLNEFKVKVVVNGVPMTGDIDKIEFMDLVVVVKDYKTGNLENAKKKLKSPTDKDPNGGDYWRQGIVYLLFIKALKDEKGWKPDSVQFDMITDEKVVGLVPDIDDEGIKIVSGQIRQVYDDIVTMKFDRGCGDPECEWCEFIKHDVK